MPTRSASASPHGDAGPSSPPRPKLRRNRPHLSCTECRRTKLKCDRQFPCLNCRRKGRASHCHLGGPTAAGHDSSEPPPSVKRPRRSRKESRGSDIAGGNDGSTVSQLDRSHSLQAPSISFAEEGLAQFEAAAALALPEQPQQPGIGPTADPVIQQLDYSQTEAQSSSLAHDSEDVGTLVISASGRSKFLGRTAASEWLQNHDVDADGSLPDSGVPSPLPESATDTLLSANPSPLDMKTTFPFTVPTMTLSTAALLNQLPALSEGRTLVNVYFRNFAWHYLIVTEATIWPIFDRAYGLHEPGSRPCVAADQLALLYAVFATATYFNIELPPDDALVEGYLRLSQVCLAKADFITKHTLAGVQALHIIASLQLGLDIGRNGDNAWPIYGLMSRITQAMGLHRDGSRFGLSEEKAEERRRVFWECYSIDVIFSNKYSRPGTLGPEFIDTAFPSLLTGDSDADKFYRIKYELTFLFWAVMEHSMRVQTPPYEQVEAINKRISEREHEIPFELRCRPHLCALPSQYPDPADAVRDSPPIEKRNLQKTFQVFTLAIKFTECLIDLHRPYFWRALAENPRDPLRSRFAPSFLTVVERCNVTAVMASQIFELYPLPAARHWWFWYHAFNAAMCMATLVIKSPLNPLVPCACSVVDSVINLYTSVTQHRNSPMMLKNLGFLRTLRAQAEAKLAKAMAEVPDLSGVDDVDDLQFLGWRTRLIERVGQGLPQDNLSRPETSLPLFTQTLMDWEAPAATPVVDEPLAEPSINFLDDTWLEQLWGTTTSDGQIDLGDLGNNWWSQSSFGELSALFPV